MDVDGGETLSMGVYPLRNFPAMEPFVSDVLRYCNKKPMEPSWLTKTLEELGPRYNVESFRR
jgi:transposase-like protein